MTTPLHHLIAAQDAAEAEGAARDDWQKIAWKLATALCLAHRGVSFALLRTRLYTDEPLPQLQYDGKDPIQ